MMTSFILNLDPILHLTDAQFVQLCQANPDLKFERNPKGELIIVSPVGGLGGQQEADLIRQVGNWNEQTGLGVVFSSSTIFNLPKGGDRSPDVAWVAPDRWNALTPEQRAVFPPLCSDFVIELRSRTDKLPPLQEKMQEYLRSGLRLGWLINPQDYQVEIYRSGQAVEIVELPALLSGENVLPGFTLQL